MIILAWSMLRLFIRTWGLSVSPGSNEGLHNRFFAICELLYFHTL